MFDYPYNMLLTNHLAIIFPLQQWEFGPAQDIG